MTSFQIASVFAAIMVAAPSVQPQRRASIPFHVSAISDATPTETLTALFTEEVPAGTRLVVEHLSLNILSLDTTGELVLANCVITGTGLDSNGNSQAVQHFIPLTSRVNLAARRESLTGGGPLAMRLEPGPISVTCSSGTDGQNLTVLQAHLSGELVSK